jgi:hypothetical protein
MFERNRGLAKMKKLLLASAFTAGMAIAPITAHASPLTGSGTVSWRFTSFSGPFSNFNDSFPGFSFGGLLNGTPIAPPSSTRSFADVASTSGFNVGSVPIAGSPSSVTLVYDLPGISGFENVIAFAPADFSDVPLGRDFVLGTLTFTNGGWFGGGNIAGLNTPTVLGFELTTSSSDGPAFNQTIIGSIVMTVNAPDPNDLSTLAGQQAEADWISLTSSAAINPFPAFRVYDSCCKPPGATNTGSVQLLARFNSLDLVGFTNPTGGGFLTTSNDPLPPVPPRPPQPVPEPAALALLLAGLGALGAVSRRRRRWGH